MQLLKYLTHFHKGCCGLIIASVCLYFGKRNKVPYTEFFFKYINSHCTIIVFSCLRLFVWYVFEIFRKGTLPGVNRCSACRRPLRDRGCPTGQ